MMRKVMKFTVSMLILVFISSLVGTPISLARAPQAVLAQSAPRVLIQLDPQVRQRYLPPPVDLLANSEQLATANIQVNYIGSGWTGESQAAFEFAAGIWEGLISSPVTIVVDADFGPLGENILGGAGPVTIVRDFDNAPQSSTWYPVATANQLANTDLDPDNADIDATFSSTFPDWDFSTEGSSDADKISFASVVLHELGHGLGFLGSMEAGNECLGPPSTGCYGYFGYPMIYDRFTENGSGTALLSYPNNSTTLGDQLTSGNLYFDSPGGNFANGGSRVPIYAPSTWSQGSSYSHLAESYNSTSHALMTYSISRGETIFNPGAVTLCMFEEMGWVVSENCSTTPEVLISGLSASNDGPTLFGTATQLVASISGGSNVSYTWDFDDGTGGNGGSVSHQYTTPGTYTAQVTAANSVSQEVAFTLVQVEEAIAGLAAANDGPTLLGTPTQLSASVSAGSNVTYSWDFGDGSIGSGSSPAYTYTVPGEYTAQVTASNGVSEMTETTLVQVEEGISGLIVVHDGPTLLGNPTRFSASISDGSNVTFSWDFGDEGVGSGPEVEHQYADPDTYTVEVKALNLVSQELSTTVVRVVEEFQWVYLPLQAKQP
jgi:hypothetical protein